MEITIPSTKDGKGKFKLIKKYKNENNLLHILKFITVRENVCTLAEISKYFLTTFATLYRKDNSISSCLKDMRSIIKQVEEFKFITNNHCINLEDNLKKFKDSYNPFTFNRSVYILSSVIFKDVHSLDLQKNNIGLDGVILLIPLIKKSPTLLHINLAYNNISDDGCKFLSIALMKNNNLQIINLECNSISDAGVISLGDSIVSHKSLRTLKMALNVVTFEGVKHLANLIEKSTTQISLIDFHYNNLVLRDDYHTDYFRKNKITF